MSITTPALILRKVARNIVYKDRLFLSDNNVLYSQFYNVISLYADLVERFFIDVAKELIPLVSSDLAEQLDIFIKQEAQHSVSHDKFNTLLEQRYPQIQERVAKDWQHFEETWRLNCDDLQYRLYLVVISEIYTARLAEHFYDFFISDLDSLDPGIAFLFGQHWAEEIEHKSLMFDIYKYLYGEVPQAYHLHSKLWPEFQALSIERLALGTSYMSALDRLLYKTPFVSQAEAESVLCADDGVFPNHKFCPQLDSLDFHPWDLNNRAVIEMWDNDLRKRLLDKM